MTRGHVARILPVVAGLLLAAGSARADHTPAPTSVTMAGSFQSEVGCPGDWQPDCAAAHLTYDANSAVWRGTFNIPSGVYGYKAALNNTWDENYGAGAVQGGANIQLPLGGATAVKFYYDHHSHWVTDNQNSVIVTAAGSFQSEIGCAGDWDPGCLRSWLQDPDGDGIYTFVTNALPMGAYETKAAIGESWTENYGAGGVPNGANIAFQVPDGFPNVTFIYDRTTHVLEVTVEGTVPAAEATWGSLKSSYR
jgi:hypothetical protein